VYNVLFGKHPSAGLELLKERNGELVEDSAAQRKPVLPPPFFCPKLGLPVSKLLFYTPFVAKI